MDELSIAVFWAYDMFDCLYVTPNSLPIKPTTKQKRSISVRKKFGAQPSSIKFLIFKIKIINLNRISIESSKLNIK